MMPCNRMYSSTSFDTTGLFMHLNCGIHLSFQDMSSPSSGCGQSQLNYLNVLLWALYTGKRRVDDVLQ